MEPKPTSGNGCAMPSVNYHSTRAPFIAAVAGDATICKITCFESKITEEHQIWLNSHHVGFVWKEDGDLNRDDLADNFLSRILKKV